MAQVTGTITLTIKDPDEIVRQLELLIQQAKRVERHARMLKRQSAQLKESIADQLTAKEAHNGSSDRSTTDT